MFQWKGKKISIAIYGTSHASEIGVTMENFPKESFDEGQLQKFLSRRKANGAIYSTSRTEADVPVFQGVSGGKIVCDTVTASIANTNVKSADYNALYGKPRPSHADFAAYCKDGRLDFSGGGEFSGRMTAPLCVAGGIAKQMLSAHGVHVDAYVSAVGNVCGKSYKDGIFTVERQDIFPSLSCGSEMLEEIAKAKANGDSVGGIVSCVVNGLPAGLGGALFDGLESQISCLLWAIPAVKGVEFGSGFDFAKMCGSTANDALSYSNGKVTTLTNNSGGLNGGISNGMPLTLSVAFRPTPSIAKQQQTVDLVSKQNVTIAISGRHDACIVPRAVPVVEAAVSLALLDAILASKD